MNYYIDTEFLEGAQNKTFLGFKYGETKPTIDLISIGIVSEDGREYYAISKDFNLKEAWNRFDLKQKSTYFHHGECMTEKVYWLRDNVLKPIYRELKNKENKYENGYDKYSAFSYNDLKRLINKYGKTNQQIVEEVKVFTKEYSKNPDEIWDKPSFYGYYADYDWVVFCWLFGKMVNLPDGFPMYCYDLKQLLDDSCSILSIRENKNIKNKMNEIKQHSMYPKQGPTKAHNALEDARWNKQLHEFLTKI